MSKCLALNPVGRITYCIRLPGGPATCGVPRRELRFAPFRKTILFVFPSGLPILTGGDLRATLTPLRSGLRLERLFQPALASSQKNSSAHQLHSGPLMPTRFSFARRRKKLAGHEARSLSQQGERHAEHPFEDRHRRLGRNPGIARIRPRQFRRDDRAHRPRSRSLRAPMSSVPMRQPTTAPHSSKPQSRPLSGLSSAQVR